MADYSATKIVLGRGRLFFDRFIDGSFVGEGERYIGNTTAFSINRSFDQVSRVRSIEGQLFTDENLIVREKHAGTFTTDNIDIENVAAWFGNVPDYEGQLAIGTTSESFVIKRGRHYQLGKSYNVTGVRHVDNVEFELDGSPFNVADELIIDKTEGRFQVLADALTLEDGNELTVTYEWRLSPLSVKTMPKPKEVLGALRFMPTNPIGPLKIYYMPYVALRASGEASLKGDEWQQLKFDIEVRKINPRTGTIYITEAARPSYTADEQAIIDLSGVTLDEFPYWDDQLNTIINVRIPAHAY